MTEWTERGIQTNLAEFFDYRRNLIVPNVSDMFWHECDLVVCTRSGYVTEVEIKVSLADMKAERRKGHGHNGRDVIRRLFYAFPYTIVEKCTPLVPEGAGILRMNRWAEIVRPAVPRKNTRPLSPGEMYNLARLGAMRIWDTRRAAEEMAYGFARCYENQRQTFSGENNELRAKLKAIQEAR